MSQIMQVGVPFVKIVNGATKMFNIGERYEQVGDTYSVQRLCGPCGGKTMKNIPSMRLLVDGQEVEVDANWMTEPYPGEAIIGLNMNDAAANFATKPTFSSPDIPEVRTDDENRAHFNNMAIFDLRDGNSIKRPYAHDQHGAKEGL